MSIFALLLSVAAAGEPAPAAPYTLSNTTPWGVLTIGIAAEGALTNPAVAAGVQGVDDALAACFPDATTVPPMSVRYGVNAGGRPGAIDATPTPAAPAVEVCVERALGAVGYAGAAAETRVALTLKAGEKLELRGLIGMKGTQLGSVVVKSTTVGDATLDACVVRAAEGWTFPVVPGGGIVIATYPFRFGPPSSTVTPPAPAPPSP
jgi:hypothetical protein